MSSVKGTWSDAEVQILRDMWPASSMAVIAERLNRTQWSVRDKIKNLGLGVDRLPVSIRPVDVKDVDAVLPPVRVCQYPHGDPGEPGFHFCEAPVKAGSPYCGYHHSICYVQKADAA